MLNSEVDAGLAKTVDFINSILNENSEVIVDESDSEEMTKIVMRNSIHPDSFQTYDPIQIDNGDQDYKLAAVDGGSDVSTGVVYRAFITDRARQAAVFLAGVGHAGDANSRTSAVGVGVTDGAQRAVGQRGDAQRLKAFDYIQNIKLVKL